MKRRHLLAAPAAFGVALTAPSGVGAQTLEKPKLTIAVGGKNLLYYLPLTIAEQRGYFKAEGLVHGGVELAVPGKRFRIDLAGLTGEPERHRRQFAQGV